MLLILYLLYENRRERLKNSAVEASRREGEGNREGMTVMAVGMTDLVGDEEEEGEMVGTGTGGEPDGDTRPTSLSSSSPSVHESSTSSNAGGAAGLSVGITSEGVTESGEGSPRQAAGSPIAEKHFFTPQSG